jgi:hypothetical protein
MRDADVVKLVAGLRESMRDFEVSKVVRDEARVALDMLASCASDRECIKSTTMEVFPRYAFPMMEAYMWFPDRENFAAIYQPGVDVSTVAKFGKWFYTLTNYQKAYVYDRMHEDVNYQITYVWATFDQTLQSQWLPDEVFVNGGAHVRGVQALYQGELAEDNCFMPYTDLEVDNVFNFANKEVVMIAMVSGKLESSVYYPKEVFEGSSHLQRFDCRVTYGDKMWVRHRRGGIPYSAEVSAVEYKIPQTEKNEKAMSGVYWPNHVDKVAMLSHPPDYKYRCGTFRMRGVSDWDFENGYIPDVKCGCIDKTHGPQTLMYDLVLMTDLLPFELDLTLEEEFDAEGHDVDHIDDIDEAFEELTAQAFSTMLNS